MIMKENFFTLFPFSLNLDNLFHSSLGSVNYFTLNINKFNFLSFMVFYSESIKPPKK